MKKLLALMLLCPVVAMAQLYPATITLSDGSTKKGFTEIPEAEDQNVRFSTSKEGDTEKISIDNVKKLTVTVDKKEHDYYTLKAAMPRIFSKTLHIPEKKSWIRMITPGKINIVATYYHSKQIDSDYRTSYSYYFWEPEKDYCAFFHMTMDKGVTQIDNYAILQKGVNRIYGEECPELLKKMDKDDITKNGIQRLVSLYEENCVKSK